MGVTTASSYDSITTTNISVTNGTEVTEQYSELRQSLKIISLIISCLTFILGVLGNGAVIWVTSFRMKKTVNTVWFLNLAVADFLFVVFLPLSVAQIVLDSHWPFGNFMCKLNSTVNSLNIFASVYILVVISVDRCVSVLWPVWAQNHRNVPKASCVSLGVWVLALIFSFPDLVFRDTGPSFRDENVINCFNNYALSDDYDSSSVYELAMYRLQTMTITRFLLGFAIPFTVIVSCYAVIIHRLRRNRTFASQSGRTFKIIAAVITIFFFCWAPFHILVLIELAYYKNKSETLKHVITIGFPIATSLAYANSCLNPLLYVFVGHDFRKRVCKSILSVMEAALQDELSRSRSCSRSRSRSRSMQTESSQTHEKSLLNTKV